MADRNTLMRELKDARECIIEHEKALFDYERLKFENAYMRALLPIVNEQNLDTLTVVPQINPRTPLLVLLYTSLHVYDKIKVGNVVIAPQGAIGRVISKQKKRNFGEVSVLLATHIQSRLPVISKESRHKAILNGQNSPLMAIKHVQPDNDDAASKDAESKPFIGGGASLFKEGETLMLLCNGAELPVAKVVMRDGVAKAQWLIDSHVNYITVVISANVLAD
ncbi:MAG: hypothetical protein LBF66_00770 [Holosporales bacterium]|nr:hypothetical protein [Holosporales bacterium]